MELLGACVFAILPMIVSAETNLSIVDKIIIGVTCGVVGLCLIIGCILCFNKKVKKSTERDFRKYGNPGNSYEVRSNKPPAYVVTETTTTKVTNHQPYTETRMETDHRVIRVPAEPATHEYSSTQVYDNQGMIDTEFVDDDNREAIGYSEWVSKVSGATDPPPF